VKLIKRQPTAGRTLLEVGGGIGAIQIELLRAGVDHAVSIELTPTYEDVATELLREAGFVDRVDRRLMDFAEADAQVESADIVVLNRVVCCYPDMPKLAGAAARHAQGLLVLSFPKRTWWTRILLGLGNLGLRAARRQFHVFVHQRDRILAAAEQQGLRTSQVQPGLFWTVVALQRAA
jgi:2-polyprenyl-3-methyl-5-hydroxy-6-metoxy-1,4-benzoquinol methylase